MKDDMLQRWLRKKSWCYSALSSIQRPVNYRSSYPRRKPLPFTFVLAALMYCSMPNGVGGA